MVGNDPHGPNKISNYIDTHETIIEQFVSRGFVVLNTLEIEAYGNHHLTITGSLHCQGGIVIDVAKILRVVDRQGGEARVQTVWYRYHAKVQGRGNVCRYDSPHEHRDFHHVHRFDVLGDGAESVEDSNWPHLGDVVDEMQTFYWENYERLPEGIDAVQIRGENIPRKLLDDLD